MSPFNALAQKSFDSSSSYDQLVRFVHVYVIEPHPEGDPSPYSGEVWEAEYTSGHPQAMDYATRMAYAQEMELELLGEQVMLIDDLAPGQLNNPMWCTYGPCPNCVFLIGQDGLVHTVQTWADADAMELAMDDLLQ